MLPSVLLTRRWPERVEAELSARYALDINTDDRQLDRAALIGAMRRYDAICPTVTDRIDADMLAAPGLCVRILANYGAGFEHIDVAAATAAGIVVTNTPDVLTEATAEIALLLMMMVARRAGEGERELRANHWTGWRPTHLVGQSLAGKRLGLLGFGRIAQATAMRAKAALGVTIAYHSRHRAAPAEEAAVGADYVPTLAELASGVDILSLHCPGGSATRHLINAQLIERMKPGSILINTARGSVVDEDALADALSTGRLAGAGLDVFEQEPAVSDRLLSLENAVLLPHLGSATGEARMAMGIRAAANLEAFFDGRSPPDQIVRDIPILSAP
jgi:lactate dehydrogenase-like 2-hydroxyacid dehydrogenase